MATSTDFDTETNRSLECDILRKCNSKLLAIFEATNLIQLSHELYSKELVNKEERDSALQSRTPSEQSSCLIRAIERKVRAHPRLFNDLVKCFKDSVDTEFGVYLEKELHQCKHRLNFTAAQETVYMPVQHPTVCQNCEAFSQIPAHQHSQSSSHPYWDSQVFQQPTQVPQALPHQNGSPYASHTPNYGHSQPEMNLYAYYTPHLSAEAGGLEKPYEAIESLADYRSEEDTDLNVSEHRTLDISKYYSSDESTTLDTSESSSDDEVINHIGSIRGRPVSCLVSDSDLECIQEELMVENYKKKFSGLIKTEMIEHESALKHRSQICMLQVKDGTQYFLLGLDKDCIVNVTQASSQVVITAISDQEKEPVCAEITTKNYCHTKERLHIEISRTKFSYLQKCLKKPYHKSKIPVKVQFRLKYSYFHGLQMSLRYLPPLVIVKRLLPQKDNFEPVKITEQSEDIIRNLLLIFDEKLTESQEEALKIIICSQSHVNCPPVLVTGPFGTGKTRLLATAAHLFFKMDGSPVRILVCTQQHVSADAFLGFFLEKSLIAKTQEVVVKRVIPEGIQNKFRDKKIYITVNQLQKIHRSEKVLLVVTYMTTRMLFQAALPQGYFTHIFLDEGAQPREPEGVIPLRYAAEDTKIVIAGDQHQVGPAALVLGDRARENGLGVSLLERLLQHYQKCGPVAESYCAILNTNHRCHYNIMQLSKWLFYDTKLKCNVPEDSIHPNAPFPLQFVCSSSEENWSCDSVNKKEISIVLGQVKQYTDSWPEDKWGEKGLSKVCILSPHRSQVAEISESLQLYHPELRGVSLQPTYNIQGRLTY